MTDFNLMQGDCLELMQSIPDGLVDMVLTDPPYGTTACKWDTVIDLDVMWAQLKRIVKPDGAIVMTAAQPFTSALVMSNPKMYRHQWVWDKATISNPMQAKHQPLRQHEDVLVFPLNALSTCHKRQTFILNVSGGRQNNMLMRQFRQKKERKE